MLLRLALAVIAVLREVAQQIRIRPSRFEELFRHRIHLGEAVVAEHDIQVLVSIRETSRHVVERDVQLRLLACDITFRALALGDVGIGQRQATAGDRRIANIENPAARKLVFQFVWLPFADALHA
jgi:hypothetical protein